MKHKRIIVSHYGGPDALQVVEEECPEPKPGEVRVRVQAAGVALPDLMMREGIHPETPRLPFTPGWDLVGVVDRQPLTFVFQPIHAARVFDIARNLAKLFQSLRPDSMNLF